MGVFLLLRVVSTPSREPRPRPPQKGEAAPTTTVWFALHVESFDRRGALARFVVRVPLPPTFVFIMSNFGAGSHICSFWPSDPPRIAVVSVAYMPAGHGAWKASEPLSDLDQLLSIASMIQM